MIFFESIPSCTYNRIVDCPESMRACNKCGWNPSVSKQRLQKFALEHPDMRDELVHMGLIKDGGDN